MTSLATPGTGSELLATCAASLFAVDPIGTGGVVLSSSAGPARERWLAVLAALLAPMPLRRLPVHVGDDRLLGGLDLVATLRASRPVVARGVLAECNGGVVLVPMAERIEPTMAGRLASVIDAGAIVLERNGLSAELPARFGMVLLDESVHDDEGPPPAIIDRLAFAVDLGHARPQEIGDAAPAPDTIRAARSNLRRVTIDDDIVRALCLAAARLGITSLRAPFLAVRVSRAAAALEGTLAVAPEHATLAASLVLAPRARVPPEHETGARDDSDPQPEPPDLGRAEDGAPQPSGALDDVVVAAALASLPPRLLARLRNAGTARSGASAGRRGGRRLPSRLRGRPVGTRQGEPRSGSRINLIETLTAAAPWQPLRRDQRGSKGGDWRAARRIEVRPSDVRVVRFRQRSESTTIFVVDASGSLAFHRLAEAKGAIEQLLADCYVRRDRVALIAFRGKGADIVLPPTRSLSRAKRNLAGLPAGGPTPLAAGLDAALKLAEHVRRTGGSPGVVLMTDARANAARDGRIDRHSAEADAVAAARAMRALEIMSLLVDTSRRPRPEAEQLAKEMGATYLPLPHASASTLSEAIRGSRSSISP